MNEDDLPIIKDEDLIPISEYLEGVEEDAKD